ncbi:hypothetical protein DM01DRAFT_1331523 [Hesseltinella vesiculosa]|uniref:Uncharacterized protein n=1 Tax=Hesseltinella vesiculosa TaxID=101127 RepID=A0A1X2GVK4_9FUNG|nr:hypothetical protein DM01DRAFT_1331523 [Hesseltinella vesiculosa]
MSVENLFTNLSLTDPSPASSMPSTILVTPARRTRNKQCMPSDDEDDDDDEPTYSSSEEESHLLTAPTRRYGMIHSSSSSSSINKKTIQPLPSDDEEEEEDDSEDSDSGENDGWIQGNRNSGSSKQSSPPSLSPSTSNRLYRIQGVHSSNHLAQDPPTRSPAQRHSAGEESHGRKKDDFQTRRAIHAPRARSPHPPAMYLTEGSQMHMRQQLQQHHQHQLSLFHLHHQPPPHQKQPALRHASSMTHLPSAMDVMTQIELEKKSKTPRPTTRIDSSNVKVEGLLASLPEAGSHSLNFQQLQQEHQHQLMLQYQQQPPSWMHSQSPAYPLPQGQYPNKKRPHPMATNASTTNHVMQQHLLHQQQQQQQQQQQRRSPSPSPSSLSGIHRNRTPPPQPPAHPPANMPYPVYLHPTYAYYPMQPVIYSPPVPGPSTSTGMLRR